jgi:hypothetical protein
LFADRADLCVDFALAKDVPQQVWLERNILLETSREIANCSTSRQMMAFVAFRL